MLLYHFPLTSSSATATIVNKGLREDYTLVANNSFASGGKISSYAKSIDDNNAFYFTVNGFKTTYSLCARIYITSDGIEIKINDIEISFLYLRYGGNKWLDVVLSNNRIYVNSEDAGFEIPYTDGVLELGGSNSFTGLIQDIRIYDYALSQAEINEYSRALVVHYPLQGNEFNQSVLKDVSGLGNDMQRYGASSYDNNSPRGDKSLHLVNANHCYYQGNMKWSDFANFTISAWIYPTSTSNYRGVIGMHSTTGGVCFAQFVSGNLRFAMITSNNVNTFFYQAGGISTNKWWHVVMSYDGSKGYVYINGELKYSANISSTPNFAHNVVIGKAFESNDRYWDGNISDVRIYATALSAEDIKNLYNSPIAVSKQHQTMAFEFKENPLYPSKYWRTPTYSEMNYILTQRTNAANLRTLGRVEISSGTYRNGLFLLPDGFVAPSGITVTITTANYTTNSYTLAQFKQLESVGVVFLGWIGYRNGSEFTSDDIGRYWSGSTAGTEGAFYLEYKRDNNPFVANASKRIGRAVRLIKKGTLFSISATTKIDFAPANLQFHCTQHIWRFAEHSYDIIGTDNANISDSYNGWIDLFGYGTSGVNYSPTLHTTTNSDYASGDISNTDNDWGINEIQSYDYNVKNFAANKNGIVQHNELRENDSDVNGCYNNKLITNELIEN